MDTLLNITNHAKRRLIATSMMSQLVRWFTIVGLLILAFAIVDRIGVTPFVDWQLLLYGSGILCIVIAGATWSMDQRTDIEVATEIDNKLQLRDRISSALACDRDKNPFATTVVSDAIKVAKENNVKSKIRTAFPIRIPAESSRILFIAVLVGGVLFSPQWNLFGNQSPQFQAPVILTSQTQIEDSIDAVIEQIKEEEELSRNLEQELAELAALSSMDGEDPEALRHEALRKMTDLQKQLNEMLQSENTLAFAEMARRLKEMKLPRNAETLPLVAALKKGNFEQAKKEFDKLDEKLNSESLSEEEKEKLREALEKLAEQLQKLSSANEALTSALIAAGLEGSLANNPDAAKKAIENAQNLNEEQKKQLLELLKTQQQANKMCKNMAQQCKNACQGSNTSKMASQLDQLKALKSFCTKAQLAKKACQNAGNKMCSSPSRTGGAGKGNGGSNRIAETDTSTVAQRSPVMTGEGAIIARQLFHGGLLTTSDSVSQVRETVLAERERAERAIADEQVPRRYHELLRHYFGQLEKLTDSTDDDSGESTQ